MDPKTIFPMDEQHCVMPADCEIGWDNCLASNPFPLSRRNLYLYLDAKHQMCMNKHGVYVGPRPMSDLGDWPKPDCVNGYCAVLLGPDAQ